MRAQGSAARSALPAIRPHVPSSIAQITSLQNLARGIFATHSLSERNWYQKLLRGTEPFTFRPILYLSSNHVSYRLERLEPVGGDFEHRQQGHREERSGYPPE